MAKNNNSALIAELVGALQSSLAPYAPAKLNVAPPTLKSVSAIDQMLGTNLNRSQQDIFNELAAVIEAAYAASMGEQRDSERAYLQSLANVSDTALDTLRDQYAGDTAMGANRGMQAANALSAILGMQSNSIEGVNELFGNRSTLLNQKATDLAQASSEASNLYTTLQQYLADYAKSLYETDSTNHTTELASWNAYIDALLGAIPYMGDFSYSGGDYYGGDYGGYVPEYTVPSLNDVLNNTVSNTPNTTDKRLTHDEKLTNGGLSIGGGSGKKLTPAQVRQATGDFLGIPKNHLTPMQVHNATGRFLNIPDGVTPAFKSGGGGGRSFATPQAQQPGINPLKLATAFPLTQIAANTAAALNLVKNAGGVQTPTVPKAVNNGPTHQTAAAQIAEQAARAAGQAQAAKQAADRAKAKKAQQAQDAVKKAAEQAAARVAAAQANSRATANAQGHQTAAAQMAQQAAQRAAQEAAARQAADRERARQHNAALQKAAEQAAKDRAAAETRKRAQQAAAKKKQQEENKRRQQQAYWKARYGG